MMEIEIADSGITSKPPALSSTKSSISFFMASVATIDFLSCSSAFAFSSLAFSWSDMACLVLGVAFKYTAILLIRSLRIGKARHHQHLPGSPRTTLPYSNTSNFFITLKLTCRHINCRHILILNLSLWTHYSGWVSCLILLVWSSLSLEQRKVSEQSKMKICASAGNRASDPLFSSALH